MLLFPACMAIGQLVRWCLVPGVFRSVSFYSISCLFVTQYRLFCDPPPPSSAQLGLGIAESLADLYAKAAVSQRQLDGAKSSATAAGRGKKAAENSRKIQGLESQVCHDII